MPRLVGLRTVLTGVQALDDCSGINEVPSADHAHEVGIELRDFYAGGAMHFCTQQGNL